MVKHLLRGLVVPMSLFLAAGCAHMGDIHPQSTLQNPQGIASSELITEKVVPVDAWWAIYEDPQLDRLIKQSLEGNPSLKIAKIRVEQAKALTQIQNGLRMPELNAGANFSRELYSKTWYFPPPIGGGVFWNNLATMDLSYDLDLWGKQESLISASANEAQAIQEEGREVQLALITAVVRAYVQLDLQCKLVEMAKKDQLIWKQNYALTLKRVNAGIESGDNLDGIEAQLTQKDSRVEAMETSVLLAKNQLAALVGIGSAGAAQITAPKLSLSGNLELPSDIPLDLIGRRPDVAASRWRVESAGSRIDAAKADFYPNINILGFIGFQGFGFNQLLGGKSNVYGYGPAISLPLFDGGRRNGRLQLETSLYDESVERYNKALIDALQEVGDNLVKLQSNQKELQLARKTLLLTERKSAAKRAAWKAGFGEYQQVLVNQSFELEKQESVMRLESFRLHEYAGLMYSLGGDASTKSTRVPAPQVDGS